MLARLDDPRDTRAALLALLPTCGTLAGIGVGLAGIVNARAAGRSATLADEFLLLSALGFLVDCYLIFFAMRHLDARWAPRLLRGIDAMFLAALTLIVFSGFAVVYEFI